MKQNQLLFVCTACDAQYAKWSGRCLECGQWGTITETVQAEVRKPKSEINSTYPSLETQRLADIQGQNVLRIQTHISELDRVLGGGIVPGSFILLGGEPGIGKSTLALQLALMVPNVFFFSL